MDEFSFWCKEETPFEVVRITTSEFLNYDGLADHVINIQTFTDGGDVRWLKIQ